MNGRGGLRAVGESNGEEFGEVWGGGRRVKKRGVVGVGTMMIRRHLLPCEVNSMKYSLTEKSSFPRGELESFGKTFHPRLDRLDRFVLLLASLDFFHDADERVGRVKEGKGREMIWVV